MKLLMSFVIMGFIVNPLRYLLVDDSPLFVELDEEARSGLHDASFAQLLRDDDN